MGRMKDLWTEIQSRGYGLVPDRYVCPKCTNEPDIQDFIRSNADHKFCSYCDKIYKTNMSISLEELIEHIMNSVNTRWCAVESSPLMYDSHEGGWQGDTIDKYDLFEYKEPLDINHDELREDILNTIEIDVWSKKYFDDEENYELESWDAFTMKVKHNIRFMAFHKFGQRAISNSENYRNGSDVCDYISETIRNLNLITTIDKNTNIYRARKSTLRYDHNKAKKMGAVKYDGAKKANRMSPAGISMFYGSFSKSVAFKEIKRNEVTEFGHIATFNSSRKLTLIDFTKLKAVPGIYSTKNQHMSEANFIEMFAKEISKQLSDDTKDHIEYIPSQIITEYLRYGFLHNSKGIDGVIYNSAYGKGKCCVLFVDHEHCIDSYNEIEAPEELYLIMKDYRRKLPKLIVDDQQTS